MFEFIGVTPQHGITDTGSTNTNSATFGSGPWSTGAAMAGVRAKGHQRTFSHGQLGHRRAGSKTDFILPEGHEERERERANKTTLSRTSSFPFKGHSRQASRTESIYTIREQKRTMLQKIMFWRKPFDDGSPRTIVANHVVPPHVPRSEHPNGRYPLNHICTTKYTILSFLPKNLFEQFHR